MVRVLFAGLGLVAALGLGPPAGAESASPQAGSDRELAQEDEIQELRRQLEVVVEELDRLRTELAVPEEPELKSTYGLGPAASKVYGARQRLSIGGYAEAVYRNRLGDAEGDGEDFADFIRMVLYFGYKFSDRIIFNSELEFEHASTSEEGSVSVEFATLDFLVRPQFNVRAGLLLIPMGFLNEIHEPPFYYGTQRPEPERQIMPTTWRENGVGIFGNFSETLSYRAYVVNGFDASGFSSSGLRGGRQKGSEATAEDLGFVARLDFDPAPGLLLGGSFYTGDSGQDDEEGLGLPDTRTTIWELHGEYRRKNLHLRALYTEARVREAAELSTALGLASDEPVAERMVGGYVEVAYDLMPFLVPGSARSLTPFFRFEYLDTQHRVPSGFSRDRSKPRRLFIPGIQYKPHPNVVLKLDYRNIDTWGGNTADELNLGFGLAF
jgi:hypothetical protein